jgi:hypothetical protein
MENPRELMYQEEISSIYKIVRTLKEGNLEKIINGFKEESNNEFSVFREFAERVKNEGYSNLGDYFADLSRDLINAMMTGELNSEDVNAQKLIYAFSYYASAVSNGESKLKALENIVFLYPSLIDGLTNKLNENGESKDRLIFLEAYAEYRENPIAGTEKLLDATSNLLDDAIVRLLRAFAYVSKEDYDNAERELDAAKELGIYEGGYYSFLRARIASHKDDFETYKKEHAKYWEMKSLAELFPSKIYGKPLNPMGLYG